VNDDFVWLNGRILPRQEAVIFPFDRGFLYGDGFFETLRVFCGRPFLLAQHLRRLNSSCQEAGWGRALDVVALKAGVGELIERNGVSDGYLRITVSRGGHRGNLTLLECADPTAFIEVRSMTLPPVDTPPSLTLKKSPYLRNEHSPVVRHKSLSYQGNLLALAEGRAQGADEVFFLNCRAHLTEGAITNLFFVKGEEVFTPDVSCGLLPGITRQAIIEICQTEGISLSCGLYQEADLQAADEVFCTNSLRGIMAVKKILDYPSLRLSEHRVTGMLQVLYAEKMRRECAEGR